MSAPSIPVADNLLATSPLARGLTHDAITRLAKLRSLFVIAQGTVFALAEKIYGDSRSHRKHKTRKSFLDELFD